MRIVETQNQRIKFEQHSVIQLQDQLRDLEAMCDRVEQTGGDLHLANFDDIFAVQRRAVALGTSLVNQGNIPGRRQSRIVPMLLEWLNHISERVENSVLQLASRLRLNAD